MTKPHYMTKKYDIYKFFVKNIYSIENTLKIYLFFKHIFNEGENRKEGFNYGEIN